jgi:predicted small integral membrane protein
MIRILKVVLALCVALMCSFYALQNVVNLQAAYNFVALMASMEGHVAYPDTFGSSITSPALIWLILWIIDMWRARKMDGAAYNSSKKFAILGAGLGVVIWFGYFHAIGGAFFQMWQTQVGAQPLQGAFQYAVMCGMVMIYLSMQDE